MLHYYAGSNHLFYENRMAYGDIVLAIVFFAFSTRAQKEPEDDKKDNKKAEDRL